MPVVVYVYILMLYISLNREVQYSESHAYIYEHAQYTDAGNAEIQEKGVKWAACQVPGKFSWVPESTYDIAARNQKYSYDSCSGTRQKYYLNFIFILFIAVIINFKLAVIYLFA